MQQAPALLGLLLISRFLTDSLLADHLLLLPALPARPGIFPAGDRPACRGQRRIQLPLYSGGTIHDAPFASTLAGARFL